MVEVLAAGGLLMALALAFWLLLDSDDDNGGGGLMEPALVPIPVRRNDRLTSRLSFNPDPPLLRGFFNANNRTIEYASQNRFCACLPSFPASRPLLASSNRTERLISH